MKRYEIYLEHIDVNGVVKNLGTLRGPHNRMMAGLGKKMIGDLQHLPENPNDPDEVRLKLTLVDEVESAASATAT